MESTAVTLLTVIVTVFLIALVIWVIYKNSKLANNQNGLNEDLKNVVAKLHQIGELIEKNKKENEQAIISIRNDINPLDKKNSDLGDDLSKLEVINQSIKSNNNVNKDSIQTQQISDDLKNVATKLRQIGELIEQNKKESEQAINSIRNDINSLDKKNSDLGDDLRKLEAINKKNQTDTKKLSQYETEYKKNNLEINKSIESNNNVSKDSIQTQQISNNLSEQSNQKEIKIEEKSTADTKEVNLNDTVQNNLEILKPKILFKNKKDYEEQYEKLQTGADEVKRYIQTLSHEDKDIFEKMISQYQNSLTRTHTKIDLNKIDDEEYSEEVTYKYMGVIERDLFKILQSAIRGKVIRKIPFYIEIENKIKEYLANIGIVTKKIECEEGKKVPNEAYECMEIKKVKTENQDISGTIKSIDLDPYVVLFYDEDDEEKEYITRGVISVFVMEDMKK